SVDCSTDFLYSFPPKSPLLLLFIQLQITSLYNSLFSTIILSRYSVGKLYIWYPNKLVFAVAQMPPSPHLHGGAKTFPFRNDVTPKTSTYQISYPRIFGD